MTDKKTFGLFIKSKRIENNYSQKDLAELLFVTEGAVSKWERGVSYPDITLISEICRVLNISEHEFITASTDTASRKIQHEAKIFRTIRKTWFLVPTISYLVALIICFICNLAVNHTLSWFFVVFSSLICAYSFVPGFYYFSDDKKLLVFSSTTLLSAYLLLLTCSVYTRNFSWLVTACIGVLIGYVLFFLPILLKNTKLSRFKFLISFSITLILTILLLINTNLWYQFKLMAAIATAIYCFLPFAFCAVICITRLNGFLKAGICTLFSTIFFYALEYTVNILFNIKDNDYHVDFNNWVQYADGNITFICLILFLSVSTVLIITGILKRKK